MEKKRAYGIIGITDEGQPIVTADYHCPYFTVQETGLISVRECWYCKFTDFRKTCDLMLCQSICRCPQNRVKVVVGGENEQSKLQPFLSFEKFASNIKGGIITYIFNKKTQSSKAVYINAGWTAITGYTLENLRREKGGNPQSLVYPEDKANVDLEYNKQMKIGNEYTLIYRVIHKNGGIIWVMDRGVVEVLSNGDIQNQSIVTEVTEIKEQEEYLQRLAQLDLLTGLYNKVTFTQQAKMILARQYDKLHGLMILDIDDFKKINDSKGRAYGDAVLEAVGGCLRNLFRNQDVLGRMGSDGFVILMTNVPDRTLVEQRAGKICSVMRDIKLDNDKNCAITVSLGVVLSDDGTDYEELLKRADVALCQSKSNGKNQFVIYT